MTENIKILVTDDSLFSREVIKDILKKNGYESIVEAANGCEALDVYCKEKPDIVILDLIMDKMDGVEALEKIMNMDKDAQVIIASALGQESVIAHCMTIGSKGYVVKPFDEKNLIAEIKKVIE